MRVSTLVSAAVGLLAAVGQAAPRRVARSSDSRLVFAHFMLDIVHNRQSAADYDNDMSRAKAAGIDAFALNIGDFSSDTQKQLTYAYTSAASHNTSLFLSFDFSAYNPSNPDTFGPSSTDLVAKAISSYCKLPAQLLVDGKVFVSSFLGSGFDIGKVISSVQSSADKSLFFAPNFPAGSDKTNLDGALNWAAWPNNNDNEAPTPGANYSVASGDDTYTKWLGDGAYIAPVSPWFSTHYGATVSYSKNQVYPSNLLWFQRWTELLTAKARFAEIITWNDYGESSYIGPLSSPHTDDGASQWVNDMPHNGFYDMAKPFIKAFKNNASSPNAYITSDELVYWYRTTPQTVNCDSTDTTMGPGSNSSGMYFHGRPNGASTMDDSVFVVAMLQSAGDVTVTSGSSSQTFKAPQGASAWEVPMHSGDQSFSLGRDGKTVLSAKSPRPISSDCKSTCGIYNFNAYVGTVPAGTSDSLDATGLSKFSDGLAKGICQPTPTFAAASSPTPSSKA